MNKPHILSNKPVESIATMHGYGLKSPACFEPWLRPGMNGGAPQCISLVPASRLTETEIL